MKKNQLTTALLLLLITLISFPLTAPAPPTTGWQPSWTTQVGCSTDLNTEQGLAITEAIATVTDPSKLKPFGLAAQKGDQLKIKVIGNNAFKLLNIRTGKAVTVTSEKDRLIPLKK